MTTQIETEQPENSQVEAVSSGIEQLSQEQRTEFQRQKNEIEELTNKHRRDLLLIKEKVDYQSDLFKLYNIGNVLTEFFVGNIFSACFSFLVLYVFLNQFNEVIERGFLTLHIRDVFPNFDIRFLTLFVSIATIVSASVTKSRRESMNILEERLALTATSSLMNKIGNLQDDIYSFRQLFYKQQDELSSTKTDVATLKTDVAELKTDVATLKTDVAELKTDVAELKTDVATLKTDVSTLTSNMARVLEILESRN
jgi:uncharacterized small protein (DUF1192 family)